MIKLFHNNFMTQNKPHKQKHESLKTQTSLLKTGEMQLGKPVRLPYIRKISTNNQQQGLTRRSLQTKVMRNSNKDLKMFENTQLSTLTLQEIQLCNQKNREKQLFPRINMLANPLLNRQKSIDSLEQPYKLRSDKSKSNIDAVEQLKDYRLGSVIGKGTYSLVRIAKNRQGKKVAIKTYMKSVLNPDRVLNLQNQIKILNLISHQSLLAFQESIQTEESFNIVTQIFDNRSLSDHLKTEPRQIPQQIAKMTMRQLTKALSYLHSMDIVHRDLKLQNILMSRDFKIKLIDFGFSRQLPRENHVLHDFCGTPHYIAPEVIQRQGYYGKPADIWSLGIIIYRISVGVFPFKGINEKTLFSKVMKAELKMPSDISTQLGHLLSKMLSFDYRKRPTAQQVLKSEWMS